MVHKADRKACRAYFLCFFKSVFEKSCLGLDIVQSSWSRMPPYADMEPHIGSEQGGKRPVVVLQNNIGNRHSPTLIVATVTTRTEKKKNQPTHVLVDFNPAFEEPSMILLEQIFTIDKSRIERFMGYATPGNVWSASAIRPFRNAVVVAVIRSFALDCILRSSLVSSSLLNGGSISQKVSA